VKPRFREAWKKFLYFFVFVGSTNSEIFNF
jgi:hypothetical protein